MGATWSFDLDFVFETNLLIPELVKIEAKRTVLILHLRKSESFFFKNLKGRSSANSVYSTNWTDRSKVKSVYSTNSKERSRAGIFKKSMGARNRGGIVLSYRPAMLHRPAELIPLNQFRGPINV